MAFYSNGSSRHYSNGYTTCAGKLGVSKPPKRKRIALRLLFRWMFYVFFALLCVLCSFYGYEILVPSPDYTLYYSLLNHANVEGKNGTLEAVGCAVPLLDPFDRSILKYVSPPGPLVCKKLQTDLTRLGDDGVLRFDAKAAEKDGYGKLTCSYRCFDRAGGDDVTIRYNDWVQFEESANVSTCEFVDVSCSRAFPALSIYSNLYAQIVANQSKVSELRQAQSWRRTSTTNEKFSSHQQPTLAESVGSHSNEKGGDRDRAGSGAGIEGDVGSSPPSVLLFVLDSVSRSAFIRALPKTYAYLREELGAVVFDAYVKVADNSFPNAIAFLTGKRVRIVNFPSELPEDMSEGYFDDWPIIWKDFSAKGYMTYYAEDYPDFNLFYFLSNGFRWKPTDHYLRPYWSVLSPSFLHRKSTHLCFGNVPEHKAQLNYLRQFWTKYSQTASNLPKFALNWLTELSHDFMNQLSVADADLAKFFRELRPQLNNTILVVMSDHGHRFDSIRESVIGRIEERMPFISFVLPPGYRKAYPNLLKNLERNRGVLTSPFDLYATLQDILQTDWRRSTSELNTDFSLAKTTSLRGSSLFRPLRLDRTCEDVSVPEDFCVCQHERDLNVSDALVQKAGRILTSHVNDVLLGAATRQLCAVLVLKEIRNAQAFLPNSNVIQDKDKSIFFGGFTPKGIALNYRIAVEYDPSGAILEGTLRHSLTQDTFEVIGDVNRINRYGNQSICVKTPLLQKFCYCI